MVTPTLGLGDLFSGQFNKEVVVNENMRKLEALFRCLPVASVLLDTPPTSPVEGSIFIVGTSPTGVWATRANQIAIYTLNGYIYVTPVANIIIRDLAGSHYRYNGSDWVAYPVGNSYTASSIGSGSQVYKQLLSGNFEFRSLVAGNNVTLTQNANDITINATPAVPFANFQTISANTTIGLIHHGRILLATTSLTLTLPDSTVITNNIQVQVRNRSNGVINLVTSGSATREPSTGNVTLQHKDVWLGFDTASNVWYIAGLV